MTQNLKTLQLSNFASTSALILSPTDGSSFILLLPQKFLLFINLKNVPHLLEEKAGMQNDGNTDGNRMYNSKTIKVTITALELSLPPSKKQWYYFFPTDPTD